MEARVVQVEGGERGRGRREDGEVVEGSDGGDADGEGLERAQVVPATDRALGSDATWSIMISSNFKI